MVNWAADMTTGIDPGDTGPAAHANSFVEVFNGVRRFFSTGSSGQVMTMSTDGYALAATPSAGGGGGGLVVQHSTGNVTVSASGVYLMQTDGGNRTATLPALSGTSTEGYRMQFINDGSNYVYVEVNSGTDDFWDGTTQKTIFDNAGAISVVASSASTSWFELGRYRTVT